MSIREFWRPWRDLRSAIWTRFIDMMDEMKALLHYTFQTRNELTLPVSAPGSAGMETCFANLVEPGDTVIVCQNGVFGGRMKENVERCGGKAVLVEDEWGMPVDPNKVAEAIKAHPKPRSSPSFTPKPPPALVGRRNARSSRPSTGAW